MNNLEEMLTCVLRNQQVILKKLNSMEKMIASIEGVMQTDETNKTPGRKKLVMIYKGKVIDNKELDYLKNDMGLTVSQILKDFKYINDLGLTVTDEKKCTSMIHNRLRRNMDK